MNDNSKKTLPVEWKYYQVTDENYNTTKYDTVDFNAFKTGGVKKYDIVGVAGGMAVFLANNVAAEVMVNVGGYRVRWGNQNTNNIEQGSITSSGANFRINLFSIKFGMTYYL